MYKTRIGGIDQWITVRGRDRANPIILFVHGSPASPLTFDVAVQRPLEEYFTMVTYDQRQRRQDVRGQCARTRRRHHPHSSLCRRRGRSRQRHLKQRYGKSKLI